MKVSPSAYYLFARHDICMRMRQDADLIKRIQLIHKTSGGTYGAPRILAELRKQGIRTSQKRIARLMRYSGLAGRRRRRFQRTTVADPETHLTNLVQRRFSVAQPD